MIITKYFSALFQGCLDANGEINETPFEPDFSQLDYFLDGVGTLPDIAAESMVSEVNLEEVVEVIKAAASNKSPGLDGISYEFYKKEINAIAPILVKCFNAQLSHLKLCPSNLTGATRLISKVSEPLVPLVSELRPITLLNCDYKILSKILANRILNYFPFIIKSRQISCVKGANICSGAFNLISTIQDAEANRAEAAILSLDMAKAYDRVCLIFLEKVLLAMNFDPKFVAWINLSHNGATEDLEA